MSTTRCFGDGDGDEHKLVPLAGDLALGSPILAVRGAYRSMPVRILSPLPGSVVRRSRQTGSSPYRPGLSVA
jgi:hypothetical protein